MEGHTYNEYLLKRRIGRGSFGDVFEASRNEQLYAVKTVADPGEGKESLEFTIAESVKLNNPFLVKYHSTFREYGLLFIVMELCPKGDLRSLMIQQDRSWCTEHRVMRIFLQLLIGLDYLHESLIFHRDLKPENIFLNDRGDVKIGDFGCGKIIDSSSIKASTKAGTLAYMSPEIVKEEKHDGKTDVWSLGVIMYEILAGRRPFNGPDALLGTEITTKEIIPINKTAFDTRVSELVHAMLRKNPASRPFVRDIMKSSVVQEFADKLNLASFFPPSLFKGKVSSSSSGSPPSSFFFSSDYTPVSSSSSSFSFSSSSISVLAARVAQKLPWVRQLAKRCAVSDEDASTDPLKVKTLFTDASVLGEMLDVLVEFKDMPDSSYEEIKDVPPGEQVMRQQGTELVDTILSLLDSAADAVDFSSSTDVEQLQRVAAFPKLLEFFTATTRETPRRDSAVVMLRMFPAGMPLPVEMRPVVVLAVERLKNGCYERLRRALVQACRSAEGLRTCLEAGLVARVGFLLNSKGVDAECRLEAVYLLCGVLRVHSAASSSGSNVAGGEKVNDWVNSGAALVEAVGATKVVAVVAELISTKVVAVQVAQLTNVNNSNYVHPTTVSLFEAVEDLCRFGVVQAEAGAPNVLRAQFSEAKMDVWKHIGYYSLYASMKYENNQSLGEDYYKQNKLTFMKIMKHTALSACCLLKGVWPDPPHEYGSVLAEAKSHLGEESTENNWNGKEGWEGMVSPETTLDEWLKQSEKDFGKKDGGCCVIL